MAGPKLAPKWGGDSVCGWAFAASTEAGGDLRLTARHRMQKKRDAQGPLTGCDSPSTGASWRNRENPAPLRVHDSPRSNETRGNFAAQQSSSLRSYFTGMTTGAFLSFTSKTVNLAGSVWLALRPTV